ncbi:hypothetical protein BUALT_Bualt05G0028100 [Buddleja alternifolia]|uniref:Uncharacterized protein n=1 Tax=Buddleja alternifolia TaxID=168488 RepID=A0AAV6XMY8_9LAMI|nr:hypothetical protein BUALT_Bualt05G0028100 [Buddleja alternifolia]
MDKNKNRTDLLAAGRKKLQQFRQKNSKGNNSKSSGKSGKSGRDASAGADDEAAVTPQNAVDGAIHDTVANDSVATTDELSGKAGIVETATPAGTAHIPIEDSGEDDTKSAQSVDEEVLHKGGSSSLLHEDGKHNVPGTSDPMIPKERFADSSIPLPLTVDFSSQLERQLGEEQVTDVGTMQEVGSSSGYQIDKVGLKQLVEDLSIYSNEFVETAGDDKITDSGNALTEEATHIATQVSEPNDASLSGFVTNDADEAQERNDHSVGTCTLPEPVEVLAVSVEVAGQEREGLSSGSTNEVKKDMLDESSGYGVDNNEDTRASFVVIDAERSLELKIDDTETSLGCKQVDLSSGLDGSLIKLSQLAEILRILDEEEFRFLFMSRESSLDKYRDTHKMKNDESIDHESFERLKEQLYVASFSKDASHLMLSEHQKLIDEISEANASSIEVQRKNEVFAEEIAQCRYELQEVLSQREELQKQLRFSKAELESFAAKVDELQNKLEMTQGDMSSLSSELFDSRNSVEALQSENEKLNGSLKMISEEKRTLLEENQNIVHENEKFTGELAQCKASLDSLQKDIVVLTENLNLLGDERMRLEEEKDALICENTKLLADLAEHIRVQ